MNTLTTPNFQVPEILNAKLPPEMRGSSRGNVKMLVLDRFSSLTHHLAFDNLPSLLSSGDVVVLNNSRTIPAVLTGKLNQQKVEIRLSRKQSEHEWEAVVLGSISKVGDVITLPEEITARITATIEGEPLVIISFSIDGMDLIDFIYRHGEPIRYEYIETPLPLDAYQTVFSSVPGSVEMCSAGRAITWSMLKKLQEKGIKIAFIQLHTGLSYYGNDIWPDPSNHPEWFQVPEETAAIINEAKQKNKRVIAVGTTVVRALESAVQDNIVVEKSGWTNLYIHRDHQIQSVNGLLTGFHEPEASHLDLLTAFISQERLFSSYQAAIEQGYLWHEFGDMNLILPI